MQKRNKRTISHVNKSLSASKRGIVEKGVILLFFFLSASRTHIAMVRESHDLSANTPAADLAGLVADVQYLNRRRRNGVQFGGDEEEEERSKPRAGYPLGVIS